MSKKGGHHGGAWKVAYADFVTAMMALFMVLWLTSQDQRIKEAVERAFRNPFSSVTKDSVGVIPSKETQAVQEQRRKFRFRLGGGTDHAAPPQPGFAQIASQSSRERGRNPVKLDLTPDGLSINVFDRSHKPDLRAAIDQIHPLWRLGVSRPWPGKFRATTT